MKLKYNFPLKGNIKFPMGIAFTKGNRLYELKVKDGFVSNLCVTISNYPKDLIPKVEQLHHNKIKAAVSIPSDPYWDDIVSDIRTMEGSLCIWGVKNIDIDYFEVEWLPESEEEKNELSIYSFSRSRSNIPPENMHEAHMDLIVRTMLAVEDMKECEVALNFYRRGILDIYEEKYIEAIYDLYFVLETLFGGGQFKKTQILNKFCSSIGLMNAIDNIYNDIHPKLKSDPHKLSELKEKYLNRKKEEIIEHIIDLRGFLHHYTIKRKNIWHPAKQREYEVDAAVLSALCSNILTKKVIDIIFQKKHIKEFVNTEVKSDDGRTVHWKGYDKII